MRQPLSVYEAMKLGEAEEETVLSVTRAFFWKFEFFSENVEKIVKMG